jgi:hypothetical protein
MVSSRRQRLWWETVAHDRPIENLAHSLPWWVTECDSCLFRPGRELSNQCSSDERPAVQYAGSLPGRSMRAAKETLFDS